MIAMIIAGGSGTRLWPLSTSTKPKQFLKIDDTGRSLLQKTYDRIKDSVDDVYIVTSAPIAEETKQQVPELINNIVIEPSRRGVANAIYLGMRRLRQDGIPTNEPVFVLWSDHLIHDQASFKKTVAEAKKAVMQGAKLVQFGIVPDYPSNQLGYIEKGESLGDSSVFEIASWKYQPDQETANQWFATGNYLWNTGYFVSTVDYILGEIERESPESYREYEAIINAEGSQLEQVYNAQEGAILDHVLSEKMQGAHVVSCTFDWVDIGNYQDLHAVSSQNSDANTIHSTNGRIETQGVYNSYVANETQIPVAVVGLSNVAVVATNDGIVVVDKSQARSVGDVAKKLQG